MKNFKKDRVLLLKALRDLVSECIEYSSINPNFEQDVAEFFIEFTDKKRSRRLKKIRKELDNFIEETITRQKLEEDERKVNEELHKRNQKVYAELDNN
jgi:hypothetical protein